MSEIIKEFGKLNKDIDDQTRRINEKESSINDEIHTLIIRISDYTNLAWFFVWLGLAIVIFAVVMFCIQNTSSGFSLNLLGDFMSGTVSAAWSLAGLFFIYVAFLGQKQQILTQQLELMYSQLEIKLTRFELYGQKQEMIEQNSTLKHQRFENSFFQLLNLLNSVVDQMFTFRENMIKVFGKECLRQILINFKNSNRFHSKKNGYKLEEISIEFMKTNFHEITSLYRETLDYYCRVIEHMLKFIDESDINKKDNYISITIDQLSTDEVILLFYYALCSPGGDKLKILIEKYSLFRNLNPLLLFNGDHLDQYKISAFKQKVVL